MVYKRTVTNKHGIIFKISNNGIEIDSVYGALQFKDHVEVRDKLRVVFLEQVTYKKLLNYHQKLRK